MLIAKTLYCVRRLRIRCGHTHRRDELWLLRYRSPTLPTIVAHAHCKCVAACRLACAVRESASHLTGVQVAGEAITSNQQQRAIGHLRNVALVHTFLIYATAKIECRTPIIGPYWNVTLVRVPYSAKDHSATILAIHRTHDQTLSVCRAKAGPCTEAGPTCWHWHVLSDQLRLNINKTVPTSACIGTLQLLDSVQLHCPIVAPTFHAGGVAKQDKQSLSVRVVDCLRATPGPREWQRGRWVCFIRPRVPKCVGAP